MDTPVPVRPEPVPHISVRRRLTELAFPAVVVLITVFVLAPVITVVLTSFTATNYAIFPPRGLSLQWFTRINPKFLASFQLSVWLALATTIISTTVATTAGLALVRGQIPGRQWIDSFLRSPLQVPLLVTGVAFYTFYATTLRGMGLNLRSTFVGLLIGHCVIAIPYVLAAVVAGLAKLDLTVEEAAEGLGATPWQTFRHVTLPMLRPALFAGAFFAFVTSFDDVPVSLFLAGSGTQPLPIELFFAVEYALEPDVFAVATLVVAFSTVLILLLEKAVGVRSALSGQTHR